MDLCEMPAEDGRQNMDETLSQQKTKEVEESLLKLHDTIISCASIDDRESALHHVDLGISYAKVNVSQLTQNSRQMWANFHMIKSGLVNNPFHPFDSVEEFDTAILVSQNPSPQLLNFARNEYAQFKFWCTENFSQHSKEICNFFERRLRRVNDSFRKYQIETSSSILLLSIHCCDLGCLIWQMNRTLIKEIVIADLYVDSGILGLKMNLIDIAKNSLENAFSFHGNSFKLYWLAASIELHKLKSMSTNQTSHFLRKCSHANEHVDRGLELTPTDDTKARKQFLDLRLEIEVQMKRVSNLTDNDHLNDDDDDQIQEIARQHQQLKDKQEKAREAHIAKKAKGKVKGKSVPRQRNVSGPNSKCSDMRDVKKEGNENERKKEAAIHCNKKQIVDQGCLTSNVNGVYKVDNKGFIKGTNMKVKEPLKRKLKQENHISRELYSFLNLKYDVRLACDLCICIPKETEDTSYSVTLRIAPHKCLENKLLLQRKSERKNREWSVIRSCPRRFKFAVDAGLCDSFLAGQECMERNLCPNPHSEEEKELWTKYFKSKITLEKFVEDLRESSLRTKFDMESICAEIKGNFKVICNACFSESKGNSQVEKKRHAPFCEKEEDPHSWIENNQKLVFVRSNGIIITVDDDDDDKFNDEDEIFCKVRGLLKRLLEIGIEKEQIVLESKRFWQKQEKQNSNLILYDRFSERHRENSVSSSNGSSADTSGHGNAESDVEEDPDKVYDSDLDDIMSTRDSDDEDVMDDEIYDEDRELYYDLKSEEEQRRLLREEPAKYKRCIIHLNGPFSARCVVLNSEVSEVVSRADDEEKITIYSRNPEEAKPEQMNCDTESVKSDDTDSNTSVSNKVFREIEIRGRANCGPCFSGDEVVVELKKTKELGDDADEVYRGSVIGILKRHINRRTYTFLCCVDKVEAHLMKPIDGIAPKINVKRKEIIERYKDNANELVAKCHMEDDKPQLDKIVRLDPKRRRDMLFVVKYLKWKPSCMYPLGYVAKIIRSGVELEDSQKVLNIRYQIPTRPNMQCSEAAREMLEMDLGDDGSHEFKDIRDWFTVTIDPSNCKDIDDALTLRHLHDGHFEVGVHIADVSQFVQMDDVIDKNARKRVTSYYPSTDTVYHMLPVELSENLCSLTEGEDRLALSVFIKISTEGEVKSSEIKRTVIRNDRKMTYEEAQKYIDGATSHGAQAFAPGNEKSIVIYLDCLAKKLRSRRLQFGQYFYDVDNPFIIQQCPDSHRLVEEFMILANIRVAEFLIRKFPDCTPIRRQCAPFDDELERWKSNNCDLISSSFYFNQFSCLAENRADEKMRRTGKGIPLLMLTINQLIAATNNHDLKSLINAIGMESFHPEHSLAIIKWWTIQEKAQFVVSGDSEDYDLNHFSLQVPYYVQFTSPIRRYMDIVIHRLVKSALDGQPAPYDVNDLKLLCKKVNYVNNLARKYHRASNMLKMTNYLKTPFYLPCFVEEFDDDGITLTIPHLGKIEKTQRMFKYSALSVSDKPVISNKVDLFWEKRFYDARPGASVSPYARKRINSRRVVHIESNKHIANVNMEDWKFLLESIASRNVGNVEAVVGKIKEDVEMEKQCRLEHLEVTSEMRSDEVMVKHHVKFSLRLKRGSVMGVQFGAECVNGYMQPVIRMVNLTPEKDFCVEHRTDPVKCFADLATEKVLTSYQSVDHYQRIWLPILAMEAATKTVAAGDTILCNNVPISLRKTNDTYYGELNLPINFCKKRKLNIFNNSKDGEEDSDDFMCIRFHTGQDVVQKTHDTLCTSFLRNIWVGHAVALYINVNKDKDIKIQFRLQHYNSVPPEQLLVAGKKGKPCTVEFLAKLLPDRRMEDAVKAVNDKSVSDLCKKIVLGRNVDDLNDDLKFIKDDTYDVPVDPSTSKIYRNNSNQTEAIRKGLQGTFTLIQGPPGTGKTVTGIKLAYWFVKTNKWLSEGTSSRFQVLYCGPSNSSVDVAAKWLKKLGDKRPKMVRVYSDILEKQVFPIPRDALHIGNQSGRRYELIDKDDHKDIALHHLLRQKGKAFSQRIRDFDKLFANNRDSPEKISDEKVEEYQKLITDASIHELKEYDIIFCTCSASVTPRILRSVNIRQIIIDECGMCMEPETLVPLAGFNSIRQVVLIGDHKQLQPIVTNSIAKSLGLDNSLFERYHDRAFMLTEQYRMHPRICEFPSRQFYDRKLVTAKMHDCLGVRHLNVWPNKYFPMVFCHAEGAEEILSVGTEDGNERSRSNVLERDEAVRIFFNLVNLYGVDADKITILSQYKAQCSEIEHNLKSLGFEHPNVGTVIASQGDEWDYVILSLVRSMPRYEIEKNPSIGWCQRNMGFITDKHQINVALTRARLGLIIIGNQHLLRCDPMWQNLLFHYEHNRLVMNSERFLPSKNRIYQKPPTNDGNDSQPSSLPPRFQPPNTRNQESTNQFKQRYQNSNEQKHELNRSKDVDDQFQKTKSRKKNYK